VTSSDVDLDRLADFVGGALDGTPDADAVRRLVTTDPDWRRAHAELVDAIPAVRLDLARLRDLDATMPADVAARLTEALAQPVSENNVVDLAERRRLRQRRIMAAGVAAAVIACGFVGFGAFRSMVPQYANDSAATSADRGNEATSLSERGGGAPNAPGAAGATAGNVIASGRDYSASSIGSLSSVAPSAFGMEQRSAAGAQDVPPAVRAPAGLERLLDPRQRVRCLDAIIREYGGVVSLIDYARYEGSPALVVALAGARIAPSNRLVVVVGPTCGDNDAISDQRYMTQI
jgi:hypothetical protein